ncbi:MAG TPA: hypothetical protein VFX20_17955 [Steroidobacteraceae bacterium]|nr:hypothetical protein [Steroidobacteraceae bacterium]
MSDMGEDFRAYREHWQEKRADNREQSTQILTDCGIGFISRNMGAHLTVTHAGKIVDFWPGTGKWIDRAGPKGRGVFPLLRHLGVQR